MTKFTVSIDREDCIICGVCWSVCPEVFEPSEEDELSQIVEEYRVKDDPGEGEIPADLEDCAVEAADSCPVEIITVEEI
ncbi:MAG: ferredoxin [Anaerolineae bacterium]